MKILFAALIATAMIGGSASAQTQHGPSTQHHRQEAASQKSHSLQGHKVTPAKKASPARYPAPPKHWGKRSAQDWQRHVDRCQQKYRSYNPKTDRFTIKQGKTDICRL